VHSLQFGPVEAGGKRRRSRDLSATLPLGHYSFTFRRHRMCRPRELGEQNPAARWSHRARVGAPPPARGRRGAVPLRYYRFRPHRSSDSN